MHTVWNMEIANWLCEALIPLILLTDRVITDFSADNKVTWWLKRNLIEQARLNTDFWLCLISNFGTHSFAHFVQILLNLVFMPIPNHPPTSQLSSLICQLQTNKGDKTSSQMHVLELLHKLHNEAASHTRRKVLSPPFCTHQLTDALDCHCDWPGRKSMKSIPPRDCIQFCSLGLPAADGSETVWI